MALKRMVLEIGMGTDIRGGDDTKAAANVARRDQIRSRQADFGRELDQVAHGAHVDRTYQVVLNGLAVKMTSDQAQAVQAGADAGAGRQRRRRRFSA